MANLPESAPVIELYLWTRQNLGIHGCMFLVCFYCKSTCNKHKYTAGGLLSGVEISEEEFFDYIETQFVDEDYYDLTKIKITEQLIIYEKHIYIHHNFLNVLFINARF